MRAASVIRVPEAESLNRTLGFNLVRHAAALTRGKRRCGFGSVGPIRKPLATSRDSPPETVRRIQRDWPRGRVPHARLPLKHRHQVLGLLVLLFAITHLDRVCISVAGPRMQADLHIGSVSWGWVTGIFALAYCLLEIPAGVLGDRIGPRPVHSPGGRFNPPWATRDRSLTAQESSRASIRRTSTHGPALPSNQQPVTARGRWITGSRDTSFRTRLPREG